MDDNSHGTHAAGTIGGVGGNATGVVGVSWDVELMALRFIDEEGKGALADAIAAIEYAIEHGAHIINASWGAPEHSDSLKAVIEEAAEANVLVVAAAGNEAQDNDETPIYPASFDVPNIISVASSDHDDARSTFSNWGANSVHLAAPGSLIKSTIPEDGYQYKSGTSMATPHVAGAAALFLSLNPGASYEVVKQEILDSVTPLDGWEDVVITGGRLGAGALLRPAEGTGDLTVAIEPDSIRDEARWVVNGVQYAHGDTAQELAIGEYEVTFTDVDGWVTPEAIQITIEQDVRTEETAVYPEGTGDLTVAIEPDSVREEARWVVNGVQYAHGDTAQELAVGEYEVTFTDVDGWVTPEATSVFIEAGDHKQLKVEYSARVTGELTVDIEPEDARSDGAQWRVGDDGVWRNSGETVELEAGSYEISFASLDCWIEPAPLSVDVVEDDFKTVTVTYEQVPGALEVVLDPFEAIEAGARWRVDGGDWQENGAIVEDLDPGDYEVSFSDLEDWVAPESKPITIESNMTTSAKEMYEPVTHNLEYGAGPNGTVDGETTQTVIHGEDGSKVVAVPDEGYKFVQWSDGVETITRRDTNVTEDLSLTAQFEVGTGSIEVFIEPQEAVNAGAQWILDGDTYASGETVDGLEPGDYTVTFSDMNDWLTPEAEEVTVEAGETAEVMAAYLDFGIADVDRLLGLSLGGNVLTIEAAGITEDTEVYIGDEPVFLLMDESDIEEGVLVVETPSQWPGEYDIRLEDPENDAAYVYDEPFVYTENPFEDGADQFAGEMRVIQDTPYGVTTAGGSLPMEGDVLQPLEHETPEGVVIEVPVEALPENATRAYVLARSAEQANHVFEKDQPLPVPEERAARSAYVDVHILVELDGDGEDYELAETEDAPVTLRFPHAVPSTGWDALAVGEMITHLDEQFQPTLPDPVEIQLSDAPIVEVDDEWAVAEVEHFTVYGLLGPNVDGDVTGSGAVNAMDIQIVINEVLGLPIDPRCNPDVTGEEEVNAQDIQKVINVALGIE
ncbi:MAG: S8 family serine peptidase [Candidatus Hydrogenedentota bacterium]